MDKKEEYSNFDAAAALAESNIPAGSSPRQFYTENQYGTITGDATANSYTFSSQQVVGGTGISITETSGNLTYAELVQEIRNNIKPYFFTFISIYAQSVAQLNTQLKKVNRGVSGTEYTVFNYPTYLNQSNPVALDVPLNFAPKTINKLIYKVQPNESVKLIINYTQGDLNAIADIIDIYLKDGIPFSKSLNQLPKEVSEKEKEYLKRTLKNIWGQRKKDAKENGRDIEIEHLFKSEEYYKEIDNKPKGSMSQLVEKVIHQDKLKTLKVNNLSESNVKRKVAEYIAKEGADKIYDPYNYAEGNV